MKFIFKTALLVFSTAAFAQATYTNFDSVNPDMDFSPGISGQVMHIPFKKFRIQILMEITQQTLENLLLVLTLLLALALLIANGISLLLT